MKFWDWASALFLPAKPTDAARHKYITLVEFALSKGTFSKQEAMDACGFTEKQFRFVSSSIFVLSMNQGVMADLNEKQEWILKPEAYFSYVQYLEFLHAIKTARTSFWLAVAAIVVAILCR